MTLDACKAVGIRMYRMSLWHSRYVGTAIMTVDTSPCPVNRRAVPVEPGLGSVTAMTTCRFTDSRGGGSEIYTALKVNEAAVNMLLSRCCVSMADDTSPVVSSRIRAGQPPAAFKNLKC